MLNVSNLVVEYRRQRHVNRPIDGLSFRAAPGEVVVLMGPSGSGKTSLLSCLGGILKPTSGSIDLEGDSVDGMNKAALNTYRRNRVGFVFQAFNLIPSLTAMENISVPLKLTGRNSAEANERAAELVNTLGLADFASQRPGQLSGGQQQRVAIARGMAHDPLLLLADEPTANLDHVQAEQIIGLLRKLRSRGRIIVISTHDDRLLPVADRIVTMGAGHQRHSEQPVDVRYVRGETIFDPGSRGDLIYVLNGGEVELFERSADGSERFVRPVSPGEYFGELGAALGVPQPVGARAGSDVSLTAFDVAQFRRQVGGLA